MRSGKLEFETLAKILLLTAFLIIVLLLFKGCMDAYRDLGTVGMREYTCWATNLMKENVVSVWPSTCREQIVKDKVDTKNFGRLMGTCWWQYGQGKWDMGPRQNLDDWDDYLAWAGKVVTEWDSVSTCYVLVPKEDIKVDELRTYMETHNVKGDKVTKVKDTMWNYLQDVSTGDNVCFDKEDGGILRKGEIYYIRFLDDRGTFSKGKKDLLIITRNKDFFGNKILTQDFWTRLFGVGLCYEYGSAKAGQETSFLNLEDMTNKINECAAKQTTEECHCSNINLIELPKNYKVYAVSEGTGKTSMIEVIDKSPPGRMIPVKGAQLRVECPRETGKVCNNIIFDNSGLITSTRSDAIRIGVSESDFIPKDICCQMQGKEWYLSLRQEEVNGVQTKILTLKESQIIKKCE